MQITPERLYAFLLCFLFISKFIKNQLLIPIYKDTIFFIYIFVKKIFFQSLFFRFLRQAQTPRENTKAMMFGENYLKEIFGIAAINSLV